MSKKLNTKCLLVAFLIAVGVKVNAQTTDELVKTVFVFNFTRYIEWPASGNEFTIGILGNDQELFKAFLDMAAKKSSASKRIYIKNFNSVSEARNCDILFISKNSSNQFAEVRAQGLKNTLIITEKPGLGRQGSGINFIEVDGKMRFEINKGEIEKAGLKVSGQLLGLATEV